MLDIIAADRLREWAVGLIMAALVGDNYWQRRKRKHSGDDVDDARDVSRVAKAQAETDYFHEAITRLTEDRDRLQTLVDTERESFRERFDKARHNHLLIVEGERQVSNDLREQLHAAHSDNEALKSEARHIASNRKLRLKLFKAQYPDFDTRLLEESQPAPLDALDRVRTTTQHVKQQLGIPRFAPDSTLEPPRSRDNSTP